MPIIKKAEFAVSSYTSTEQAAVLYNLLTRLSRLGIINSPRSRVYARTTDKQNGRLGTVVHRWNTRKEDGSSDAEGNLFTYLLIYYQNDDSTMIWLVYILSIFPNLKPGEPGEARHYYSNGGV